MLRHWCAVLLALSVSACGGGFTGNAALFADNEGYPIFSSDGTLLRPGGGGPDARERVTRDGAAYEIGEALTGPSRIGGTSSFQRPEVRFIPIAETPEDDYVAQIVVRGSQGEMSGQAIYYAFVLRVGPDTFAAWTDPETIKAEEGAVGPEDEVCKPNGRDHGECEFESRDDLVAYYRTYVHDRFIRESEAPNAELIRFVPLEVGSEHG